MDHTNSNAVPWYVVRPVRFPFTVKRMSLCTCHEEYDTLFSNIVLEYRRLDFIQDFQEAVNHVSVIF